MHQLDITPDPDSELHTCLEAVRKAKHNLGSFSHTFNIGGKRDKLEWEYNDAVEAAYQCFRKTFPEYNDYEAKIPNSQHKWCMRVHKPYIR